MKNCKKCGKICELSEFYKSSRHKDKLNPNCIICVKSANSESHSRNKKSRNEHKREYYESTKNKFKLQRKKYTIENRENKTKYDLEYRKKNKQKITKQKSDWEKLHRNDPEFKIKRNLRRRIHHALNGLNKSDNTMSLLGCSVEFFIQHIESQFKPGMSWDNYGPKTWHIDHIKPCYTFDLTDPKQQQECFHYSNQRPLWAKDNLTRPRSQI